MRSEESSFYRQLYIHALSYREAIKIGSIGWVGIGLFLLRGKLRRF